MPCIYTNDPHLLTPILRPPARHILRMRTIAIYADERAGNVGLLVEMCESEALQRRSVVENCGLVLCAEASREGVPSLGRSSVDAVYC